MNAFETARQEQADHFALVDSILVGKNPEVVRNLLAVASNKANETTARMRAHRQLENYKDHPDVIAYFDFLEQEKKREEWKRRADALRKAVK